MSTATTSDYYWTTESQQEVPDGRGPRMILFGPHESEDAAVEAYSKRYPNGYLYESIYIMKVVRTLKLTTKIIPVRERYALEQVE